MTLITRVGHCENCQKNHKPKFGEPFAVIGQTERFHIYLANKQPPSGFSPFFYRLKKVIGQNVVYERLCGICEVTIFQSEPQWSFIFHEDKWQRGIMTIEQWNSLILFKDSGYQI